MELPIFFVSLASLWDLPVVLFASSRHLKKSCLSANVDMPASSPFPKQMYLVLQEEEADFEPGMLNFSRVDNWTKSCVRFHGRPSGDLPTTPELLLKQLLGQKWTTFAGSQQRFYLSVIRAGCCSHWDVVPWAACIVCGEDAQMPILSKSFRVIEIKWQSYYLIAFSNTKQITHESCPEIYSPWLELRYFS